MTLCRIALICIGFLVVPAAAKGAPDTCNESLHYLEWTQKYFASADSVFLGTVIAEELPIPPRAPIRESPGPVEAKSMSELIEMIEKGATRQHPAPRLQEATFSVDKAWKGADEPVISVTASLYADDTGRYPVLRDGETYLVFAWGNETGVSHVPLGCSSHESAAETDSRIRVLDALAKRPGD